MGNNDINKDLDNIKIATEITCTPDTCIHNIGNPLHSLKIICLNIRSIHCAKNFNNFEILLDRLKFTCDIIILTECWLSYKNPPNISGYKMYYTDNVRLQNDGVVMYIRSDLDHNIDEPSFEDANCLLLTLKPNTAILGVYRSPSYNNTRNFLNSLENTLSKLKTFSTVVVTGDINLDIRNGVFDSKVYEYLELISEQGLQPAHTLPTRFDNCLDHVLLKTSSPAYICVLQADITDHLPVVLSINKPNNPNKPIKFKKRTDWAIVLDQLSKFNFESIFESNDEEDT